jgi:hypothetical protein
MQQSDPPLTLADLVRARIAIACRCRRCFHAGEIPAADLAARLGADTPVARMAAGGALYCRACGARDVDARPAWGGT